jgi:hypothetical protein
MHTNFTATAGGITRRNLIAMLASGITLPSLPFGRFGHSDTNTGFVDEFESKWEAQGRIDAGRGIFRPPHAYVSWTHSESCAEAEIQYQRGYWREFERLRFEAGVYDLL